MRGWLFAGEIRDPKWIFGLYNNGFRNLTCVNPPEDFVEGEVVSVRNYSTDCWIYIGYDIFIYNKYWWFGVGPFGVFHSDL